METAQKAFAMGVPFNDINQVYDLGFESLPWGDTGYLPGTLREVGVKVDSPDSISAELDPFERLTRLLENSEQAVIIDSKSNVPDKALIRKLSRYLFEQRGRVLSAVERNWETGHDFSKLLFLVQLKNGEGAFPFAFAKAVIGGLDFWILGGVDKHRPQGKSFNFDKAC